MALSYGFCLGTMGSKTNSGEFSQALRQISGDGVCAYGSRFAAEISGFALTVGSGFALAAGRWLKNTEPVTLALAPASSHGDRVDLAAVQVDLRDKKARLCILTNWDPAAADPLVLPLYAVAVKRGATNLLPSDITDLRKALPPLSQSTVDGLRTYDYVTGGLDQEVARILAKGDALIDKGDQAVEDLDQAIIRAGAMPAAGDLTTARHFPGAGWFPCSGGPAPPQLRPLVGETLPTITPDDPRMGTWIFGGEVS